MFPSEKETDPPFHAALEKYRASVVVGANLEPRDQAAAGDEERTHHTYVPPARTLIPPPPSGMDSRVGYVNFWPDGEDQVVRRVLYKTNSLELDPPKGVVINDSERDLVSIAARVLEKAGFASRVPERRGPIMFRFAEDLRPVSLYTIFVPTLWQSPPVNDGALFRNKIVLIGPDGNWIKDELTTPFGPMLGPRLHLSAINAALTGAFLKETPGWVNLLLIFGGGAVAWVLGRFVHDPLFRFFALVIALAGAYVAAQMMFNYANIVPLVLSPLLALAASGVSFSVVEQVHDRLEKARMRKTFERYVSRDVVKELLDNPEGWLNTLGGVRKKITVLFSDVRGFTTMTESADAAQLVAQLNEYFTDMVRIVFEHNGTLDKFIGDAVMAHWGSIVSEGEKTDAVRAVASALDMQRALARLNTEWKPRGMLELHFGIGINQGEAIVGNLGSEEKREVSAIGDPVNLASRLEGVTKEYHIEICLGENVEPLVRDDFIIRSLDLIVVKGKTKPVEVFTVIAERKNGSAVPPWLPRHEEAMRAYRSGRFAEASAAWRDVLAQVPEDGIAQLFVERCAALQADPPEGEWRGVFEMKSK
jgi:adenylate cyclase